MLYRERLWPSPWVFLTTALVIPASLLVFLPISPIAGVAVAVLLYAAVVGVLVATTPTIEVTADELRAGRARLPRAVIAAAEAHHGAEATAQRGVHLDARAWLLVRGWLPDLVRIDLADPDDPTPYWLVSTRNADALASALKE